MKIEIWKDIPGYEGKYQVSDQGRVRRLEHKRPWKTRAGTPGTLTHPAKMFKLQRAPMYRTKDKNYLRVCLAGKEQYVHRLVALAFIPNPGDLPWVLHGNGDPADNRKDNLRWGTPQDNSGDRIEHGNSRKGELCGTAKLTELQVREIRALYGVLKQPELARRYGVQQPTISRIINGKRWAA